MWLTASDWQKWYDSWMNDPLTTIDAEQLEQNVSNAFKTIFKCVKHFKEIPACQEVAMEVKEKIENLETPEVIRREDYVVYDVSMAAPTALHSSR